MARALAGDPTYSDDLMLFMERSGFREEVYFTFSYSPVPDESGGVGGMFCACTETTARVIGERRLRTLRDLAVSPADARTVDVSCVRSADVLSASTADIPFALIYLQQPDGGVRLVASTGVAAGDPAAPVEGAGVDAIWPAARVMATGTAELVTGLSERIGAVPAGPWPEPPPAAKVLPLTDRGLGRNVGAIVLGISARRPFDAEYRRWFELLAAQIGGLISNARAAEDDRQRAEALAELDRAKTTFFSNVSHEFRTPLALMLGPLEQALTIDGLPAESRQHLEVAQRNSQRLLKLVNTLLDFSRIEAGRLQAHQEPVDLGTLTADVASVFRSTIESAGLTFTVDCPPLDEPVAVDREMWEKVVLNLLSNAFKFTLDGAIAITLRREGDTAVLTVRDTGTGIAAAELPHLFQRFHRVRGAGGRSFEGSGIGLALVRELVRLHHGEVHVESAPGQGSTFRVTIPARGLSGSPHAAAAAPALRTPESGPASQAAAMVAEASRWLPGSAGTRGAGRRGGGAAAHRRRRRQRRHARLRGRPARPDQPRRGGRRRHGRARRPAARAGRPAARRRDDAAPGRPGAAADDPRRRGAAAPPRDLRLGARRRGGARRRARGRRRRLSAEAVRGTRADRARRRRPGAVPRPAHQRRAPGPGEPRAAASRDRARDPARRDPGRHRHRARPRVPHGPGEPGVRHDAGARARAERLDDRAGRRASDAASGSST